MKVAHLLRFSPHKSGLYETARELIQEERNQGVDARFFESSGIYHSYLEDREVFSCNVKFLEKCDLVVMHQMIPRKMLNALKQPIVLVLHGTPRDCMWGEIYENSGSHSTITSFRHDPRFSFITMWPRHVVFWKNTLPNIELIPATVDTKYFNPGVEPYVFPAKALGIPNIVFGDTWRIDKQPFEMLHAFKLFKEKYPKARIHLYCRDSSKEKTWREFLSAITGMQDNFLGEYSPMTTQFPAVIKAADFVVTPQRDATRVIRESLAVGTPVVAGPGCPYTHYKADFYYPEKFFRAMDLCWQDILSNPTFVQDQCKNTVEKHFSLSDSVSKLIVHFQRRLNHA